jgi:hypothetical protein
VLTLDAPVDTLEAQKKLLFLPNRLTDGIELSDDRLPVIRSEVYLFGLRAARQMSARAMERQHGAQYIRLWLG